MLLLRNLFQTLTKSRALLPTQTHSISTSNALKAQEKVGYNKKSKLVFLPDVMKKTGGPRSELYKPNIKKRMNTYGLKTRLSSRGGKQILWNKILQGPRGWVRLVVAP